MIQTKVSAVLSSVTLLVALCLQFVVAPIMAPSLLAAGSTYYVSRSGNNADGGSWATAWNELNKVNWSVIQPGDTILVAGGTYNTTLSNGPLSGEGASGTAAAPITIRADGNVVIDGQGSRRSAIYMGRPYVIIDGVSRYGFEITRHTWAGVEVANGGDNVTLQFLHVHHNPPDPSGGDIFGVRTSGADGLTIRNCEINDNGQDAIQSILGGNDVLLEGNYIHSHHYNHPDALQMQGGDRLVIRSNVISDGFMQGIFLGENSNRDAWSTDVEMYDNLLYGYDYGVKSKNTNTQNWNIHNNTFANLNNFAIEWCCASPGSRAPMVIRDNIFSNTAGFYLSTGDGTTTFADNCVHESGYVSGNVTQSGTISGDPRFVDPANGDFALQSGSPCAGKGSSITSLSQLLGQSPQPTPSPTPTSTPSPTPTPVATSEPLPGLAWEAESGTIISPFTVGGLGGGQQYVYQTSETSDPTQGGRAAYRFNVTTPGRYVVKMVTNASSDGSNSVFINIDGEPTNPNMIWDIPVTQGFQERTASWRGTGTPDSPQYAPRVFTLFAGQHELIIRGREQETQADRVEIVLVEALSPDQIKHVFLPHISR